MKHEPPCRIMLLIPSLNIGGAEVQLVNLAKGLYGSRGGVTVVTFYDSGRLFDDLKESGVPVVSLKKAGRWDIFGFLRRFVKTVRTIRPDLIYGFLGTPNIIIALLKPFFPGVKIVWGIRYSEIELHYYDWLSRLSYLVERGLAFVPDLIIANSNAGLEYAKRRGFPPEKIRVVQNGIDTERFFISPEEGKGVRREWGVGEGQRLVGMVGRLDPIKDHGTFLMAASTVSGKYDDVRFVFVGDGPADYTDSLKGLAEELGLGEKIIWAGYHSKMNAVYNALDIFVSSSLSEGFSNVICEAMACGVYPVVTNVGDSALILGDCGRVVSSNDARGLAEGLSSALSDYDYQTISVLPGEIRERIVKNFGIDLMVKRTEDLLEGLCREK
ncbi:MAG: glycosyltransferase [Deltaproteobacteria bacterium]|uniref:Glycosyltransferase n=1 Tax=Candidatus Zymogenus saltonus TaxID=2844893 RepID=A0A9D8PR20_9DELT|nr:glycosyltransferase [Candidatus Zymogenus saltonus]